MTCEATIFEIYTFLKNTVMSFKRNRLGNVGAFGRAEGFAVEFSKENGEEL
jgi:hypothetical protein